MNIKKYKKKLKRSIQRTFFRGTIKSIDKNELEQLQRNGAVLLDVRSLQEYNEFHLKGSINIPLYELNIKVENILINRNQPIIVYCQSGSRSKRAIQILNQKGYNNLYELEGGLDNSI